MIPLAIPNISGNEAKYLLECVETNFVSSVGPFVSKFEKMVAEISGAKYAVATCSGTAGLHLALTSIGVKRDELVLLPSFTFIASANAVSHCGADPWLIDIDKSSWTMDVELLEKILNSETEKIKDQTIHKSSGKRVGAIMPVYTLGQPCDMTPLMRLAKNYGLPVVADAAAALGSTYREKRIGGLADLTDFSFNGNKTFTAGGGGMVVGNNKHIMDLAKHLSTTARVGNDYYHDHIGYNYRLTNIQAAVGCAQLENIDKFVSAKQKIARIYDEKFAGIDGISSFPRTAWAESACWFSGITLQSDKFPSIDEICKQLHLRGVDARKFWQPVHKQPMFLSAIKSAVKNSEDISKKILTLPCSTQLKIEDQLYVVRAVKDVLRL